MLRKMFVLPILGMSLLPAVASARFEAGNMEMTLSGSGVSNKSMSTGTFGVGGSLGYFLTPELEVLVRQSVSYADNNFGTFWGGTTAGALDYHFDLGEFQPFIGAGVGYSYGSHRTGAGVAFPEAGVKYFVNSTTFVYGMAQYEYSFKSHSNDSFVYQVGVGFKW